jgi:hypothetical protein
MENRSIIYLLGAGAAVAIGVVAVSAILAFGPGRGPAPSTPAGVEAEAQREQRRARPAVAPEDLPARPARDEGVDGGSGRVFLFGDGNSYSMDAENAGLVACMRDQCNALPSRSVFDMCRRRECGWRRGDLTVSASAASFAGGKVHVEARLAGNPGTYADKYTADPVYVGLTLRDGSGQERDVEVIEVPLARFADPVVFDSEVGGVYAEYVVAAWGGKQQPCSDRVKRDGCDRFGYAVQHLAGSSPADAYGNGKAVRMQAF